VTVNTYPLLKTRLSNERLMSALLLVLLLYNLPRFVAAPGSILPLLLLLVIGLVMDAAIHLILYKRPICAVSAAVTALILYTLSPGALFWAEFAALAAALVIGKAIWGGTGKNPLNPAMFGLAFMAILSPLPLLAFDPSYYLLPAILLSLPFLFIRPFAGLGMIIGMLASLLIGRTLTAGSLLSSGVFFWGCLVITDPVTTTSKPAAGFVIGLLAGFVPGLTDGSVAAMPIAILVSNLLSYLADWLNLGRNEKLKKTFGRNRKIMLAGNTAYTDLAGDMHTKALNAIPSCEEILRRIEKNKVFGMGGAAFPAANKIRTVMESKAPDKHLIINAAECDPGLVHDKWLLRNRSNEILQGIEILQKCSPFKSVTVAAKSFDGVSFPEPVRLHKVSDFYPAGAEKILVGNVLKKASDNQIPAASGILVLNVQTVYAIREAVMLNRKADTRFLTIADLDNRTGKVVRVKLGAGVYETAREVLPRAVNIYTGGGIMNAYLADDDAVIDEKTNFLAAGPFRAFREAVCSQCNFCSAYCPAALHVREIAHYIDENKPDKAALLHPEKCMECGLCSSVCMAGRDQAKRVKTAKIFVSEKDSVANDQTVC
jgi:Na+-translocating ferredoxin:NAD+ oxidoreductase RnfD subunit/ferredoxin